MTANDDNEITDDEQNLVAKGMADLPRDEFGNVNRDALRDYIAARLAFDEQAERRKKAVRMIGDARKPGVTEPDGQLVFDGIDPYDYEPDRLVQGDPDPANGVVPIVETSRALSPVKQADARRKIKKARDAMRRAEQSQAESSGHSDWTIERIKAGEKDTDLPFGRYVRETGIQQFDDDSGVGDEGAE